MLNPHEAGFLKFIDSSQARRISALLAGGPRGRSTFHQLMGHNIVLNPAFSSKINPHEQSAEEILSLLFNLGAPKKCYIISEDSGLDTTIRDLKMTLEQVVGYSYGTFISCLPGVLGYYEYEAPKERFLLKI